MHFPTVFQFAAIISFVNAAPIESQGTNPFAAIQRIALPRLPVGNAFVQVNPVVPRLSVSQRPVPTTISTTSSTTTTTTPKPTTTSTTTASSAIWTSVNQASCSNSYPTGTPDFTKVPTSCGVSWLDILSMWRKAYGLPGYTWSPHLAEVAYGAAYNASGGAKQFQHSNLQYWNSSAEVESPGYVAPYDPNVNLLGMTPFANAIANWMCEVPSDPQLKSTGFTGIDLCTAIVRNVDYIGENPAETGHHDIMLGPYTLIGCAFVWNTQNPTGPFAGIYVCDFN